MTDMIDGASHEGTATGAGFRLRIEFTGLAVFAEHGDEMLVLQPDARQNPDRDRGRGMVHRDGYPAAAHAGYLSFDARHLLPGAGSGDVVVRFNREAVTVEGMPAGRVADAVDLPDFSVFAPVVQLDSSLHGKTPAPSLLSRIHLSGGALSGKGDGKWRTMSRVLTSPTSMGHQQASNTFAHGVEYETQIAGAATVTIRLTAFDGSATRAYTLSPVKGEVRLRVANLCADNPLEWREFPVPAEVPSPDLDFKWLSTLFTVRPGEADPRYDAVNQVPHLIRTDDQLEGLIHNCFPARGRF